jgi:hypothetical protein
MKDAYEVLYQKEADLTRIRKEIESLRMAAELIGDEDLDPPVQNRKPAQSATSPELTGTDAEPFIWPRLGFWGNLIRR